MQKICQSCGGNGQVFEEMIMGWPRYIPCGFCQGIGKWTKQGWYWYMQWCKQHKVNKNV